MSKNEKILLTDEVLQGINGGAANPVATPEQKKLFEYAWEKASKKNHDLTGNQRGEVFDKWESANCPSDISSFINNNV